jgi:aryl-alcohol dehydrogenase-like predicted oxidoreductase
MLAGSASREGTKRLAARFPAEKGAGFYRDAQGLLLSNIGIGTYLGDANETADHAYIDALSMAMRGGINVIDSAINYRHQRSERCVGTALYALRDDGKIARDEVLICTKAGFLVPGAIPADELSDDDVVGGIHSMAPVFLADQLERSRSNIGVQTIDVFYLHNPETQLGFVSEEAFYERAGQAFAALESMADEGKIVFYGMATWEGFRKPRGSAGALSLGRLIDLARAGRGDAHRFRFLQLPFNLAMSEALRLATETVDGRTVSVLEAAARSGLTVIASASLLQARLAHGLPETLSHKIGGTKTDAQRAIQFTRSTPGITTALAGMGHAKHVSENMQLACLTPIALKAYQGLYQ